MLSAPTPSTNEAHCAKALRAVGHAVASWSLGNEQLSPDFPWAEGSVVKPAGVRMRRVRLHAESRPSSADGQARSATRHPKSGSRAARAGAGRKGRYRRRGCRDDRRADRPHGRQKRRKCMTGLWADEYTHHMFLDRPPGSTGDVEEARCLLQFSEAPYNLSVGIVL